MKNEVLIIEDSKAFAEVLKQNIEHSHGFAVTVAESLSQAKTLLDTEAKKFFCAVVDLSLPDAPCGEAVNTVVALGIPTLVFTGTLNQAIEEDLWALGISDYAHKSGSYNLEYIVWKIKRLYDNSRIDVMVVDDSIVACKGMGKLLRSQRFKVHMCAKAEEALATIEEVPNIRIVITDCNMTGMDGLELTAKLRERYSSEELEIIGVSAGGGQGLSVKFIKLGANDFIYKPLVPEEFHCRVNRSAERIDTYSKLNELNQLKNQFLGTAAHDIRGPIASIKTAADYLLRRNPTPERAQNLLQMVSDSSDDLLELLNSLLDISVVESGQIDLQLSKLDLKRLVADRLALYQATAETKGIEWDPDLQTIDPIQGDKIKLIQVIDNLLTNAIKYSPSNTRVAIKLQTLTGGISLWVIDSGQGIDAASAVDLFKPYKVLGSKTTAGEKSTGLGLAIVKRIVDAHKGTIEYERTAEGGSAFKVTLPR